MGNPRIFVVAPPDAIFVYPRPVRLAATRKGARKVVFPFRSPVKVKQGVPMRLRILITFVGLLMLGASASALGDKTAKPERIGLWNKKAPLGDGKFQEAE